MSIKVVGVQSRLVCPSIRVLKVPIFTESNASEHSIQALKQKSDACHWGCPRPVCPIDHECKTTTAVSTISKSMAKAAQVAQGAARFATRAAAMVAPRATRRADASMRSHSDAKMDDHLGVEKLVPMQVDQNSDGGG